MVKRRIASEIGLEWVGFFARWVDVHLQFETAAAFRAWLSLNVQSEEGVWLVFGKSGGPLTLSANEALEEALCFGWIDGQIQTIDDVTYRKYFSPRRKLSEWSHKNIALAESLIAAGRMAPEGLAKIEEAVRGGRFQPKARPQITEATIAQFIESVRGHEPAYTNLLAMPPSVHRTYTGYSLDVKSEQARRRRLEKIIDRLNQNLKPM